MSVPTIAFAMPPPASPTGFGIFVKKSHESDADAEPDEMREDEDQRQHREHRGAHEHGEHDAAHDAPALERAHGALAERALAQRRTKRRRYGGRTALMRPSRSCSATPATRASARSRSRSA